MNPPRDSDLPAEESEGRASATSASLIERARERSPRAWEELVTLYAPSVLAWCRRGHLSESDAADVFQEVFRTVAAKIDSFRRERPGDTFRGWLRTITRNKVNDHYRRVSREPRGSGGSTIEKRFVHVPDEAPANEDDDDNPLFRRALERIRGQFREHTWQAFWRTTVDERPAPEVANELGMSPGAVRVAKSRVLQRLREELGDLS